MPDELLPADIADDIFLYQWSPRAEMAYKKYGDSVGWKNYAGHPMPTWPELPRRIQAAWCFAAQVVVADTKDRCASAVADELKSGWAAETETLDAVKAAISEME